jgi:hypothetical protein
MYLTLQRRTGLWLYLEKRIVGVENVVEDNEYNYFDKISFFDTSYKPQLLETNKTPYLRSDYSKKNPYTEIKEEKASLVFAESFFVMPEDVSIGGNGICFVI